MCGREEKYISSNFERNLTPLLYEWLHPVPANNFRRQRSHITGNKMPEKWWLQVNKIYLKRTQCTRWILFQRQRRNKRGPRSPWSKMEQNIWLFFNVSSETVSKRCNSVHTKKIFSLVPSIFDPLCLLSLLKIKIKNCFVADWQTWQKMGWFDTTRTTQCPPEIFKQLLCHARNPNNKNCTQFQQNHMQPSSYICGCLNDSYGSCCSPPYKQ